MTLTGTGLQRTSSVHFGYAAATGLTRLSATQVRVTVPAHSAGTVEVRVTTPGARRPSPPRPLQLRRAARRQGTDGHEPVRVGRPGPRRHRCRRGRDQLHRDDARHLRRDDRRLHGAVEHPSCGSRPRPGRPASPTSRCVPRPSLSGLCRERLLLRGPPDADRRVAASGPTTGGTVVTLTGTGLGRATAAQFGTATTTHLVRVSATTLRVTAPAGAAGTVDVRVTTPVAPRARRRARASPSRRPLRP